MNPQTLFDRYNTRYFGNRLPRYEIVTDGTYAGGRCDCRERRLYVAPGKHFRRTLIHEMAHAAVRPNGFHGPIWRKEMARLHSMGAPIPRKEYEQYAIRAHEVTHADILQEIVDAASQVDTQPIPVRTIVQDICWGYGIVTKDGVPESAFAKQFIRKAIREAERVRG